MLLKNKTVMITGASSGIGRCTAILAAKNGATVILLARNIKKLNSVKSELFGSGHSLYQVDFSNENLNESLKEIFKKIGKIDGLFHCAGQHLALPLKACQSEQIEYLYKINVLSTFTLLQHLRKKNNHKPNCSILLMSSASALIGESGLSVYSSSKAALISLCRSLSSELIRDNIRINCISAGIVKTDMTESLFEKLNTEQMTTLINNHPMGLGSVTDVANGAMYLLSDMSKWVTGTNLVIDGGYTAIK